MPWKDNAINAIGGIGRLMKSKGSALLESFKLMVGNVYEWIMPKDERKPPPDATKLPWCAICYLEGISAKGNVFTRGTGFLINPTTVVTAAHNLCEVSWGSLNEAVKINVFPGTPSAASKAKPHVAARYVYDKNYIEPQVKGGLDRSCHDYGVIFLDAPVHSDQSFYFDTHSLQPDSENCRQPVTCAGYPQDKGFALLSDCEKEPWPAEVARFSDNGRLLLHDVYVSGGQSGAPIFLAPSGPVVGIHVKFKGKTGWVGVCVTQQMKDAFDTWKTKSSNGKIGKMGTVSYKNKPSHAVDFSKPAALI